MSRRLLGENGSEEELTGALLAWQGDVQEAHGIFLQAMKVLGDDPTSHAADSTLSALGRLQSRIESQLSSAGAASPDSKLRPHSRPDGPGRSLAGSSRPVDPVTLNTLQAGLLRSAGLAFAYQLLSLDALLTRPPDVVKVDVSGAEIQVLRGAGAILRSGRSTWLVKAHGAQRLRQVAAILAQSGYAPRVVREESAPGPETYLIVARPEPRRGPI